MRIVIWQSFFSFNCESVRCCAYNHWVCPTKAVVSAIETVPNESNSWSESSYRSKIEDPSESDLGEFGAAYFGLLAETF